MDPANRQDVATMTYVDSTLARKKLGSELFLPTRTAELLEVRLSDSAGLTSKLVFTYAWLTLVE